MYDLISRQAAISEIMEDINDRSLHDDPGTPEDYAEGYDEGIRNAAAIVLQMASAQPEQKWIPCSERLPKEKDAGILKKFGIEKMSEYVIATVEVKDERMTVTACTHNGKWNWNMKYAFPDYKVVAWMPLPEPWIGKLDG